MKLGMSEDGEGDPLVLLHGMGTDRTIWADSLPLLAEERRVFAPDIPGFGESPPLGPGFDLEEVTGALVEGLADAGAESPYDLVGQSLGGALAIVLAAHHPGSVRRVVAGAPAGFTPRSDAVAKAVGQVTGGLVALRRTVGLRVADSALARRLTFAWGVADGGRISPERAREMLEASRRAQRVRAAMEAILAADLTDELETMRAPLGLLWGARDPVVPLSVSERIAEMRPDAVVEVIPDVAHIPHVERPVSYVEALTRLLDQMAPAAAET